MIARIAAVVLLAAVALPPTATPAYSAPWGAEPQQSAMIGQEYASSRRAIRRTIASTCSEIFELCGAGAPASGIAEIPATATASNRTATKRTIPGIPLDAGYVMRAPISVLRSG